MRLLIPSSLVILLAATSAANAGSYVSLGVGSDAALSGDLASNMDPEGFSVGRLAAGYRMGPVALEAGITGTGLREMSDSSGVSAVSLGVDLKYYLGLLGPIEGYFRGGLSKTWLGGMEPGVQYVGRSIALGGGVQYTFDPLPIGEAAIWLDFTHQSLEVSDGSSRTLGGAADLMTAGLSLGF